MLVLVVYGQRAEFQAREINLDEGRKKEEINGAGKGETEWAAGAMFLGLERAWWLGRREEVKPSCWVS